MDKIKELLKIRKNQFILGLGALAVLGTGTGIAILNNSSTDTTQVAQVENQKKYDEEKEKADKTEEEKKKKELEEKEKQEKLKKEQEEKAKKEEEEKKKASEEVKKAEEKPQEKTTVSHTQKSNTNTYTPQPKKEVVKETPKPQPKKEEPKKEEKPKEKPIQVETHYPTQLGNSGMFFSTRTEAENWAWNADEFYSKGFNRFGVYKVKWNGQIGWTVQFRK